MRVSDDQNVHIRVLGPIEVVSESGVAHLGGPKQRAVLAMLTARAGRVVTTDELVDGIWGDNPPTAVASSIHSYISTLRTAIERPIERRGAGYSLTIGRFQVDANIFEDALDSSRRELIANPTASAEGLRKALALWRGRAYADVSDLPGLEAESRRLTDLRLTAVELRIEADLALGRHAAVVGELEALAAEHPFRESLRAKHMLALYRDGRQADALRAYQRTRDHLREELGVDPSPELAELEERILNHDYTLIHSREVVSEQVALLFTDIVDSTLLWETNPAAIQAALARHDHLVQSAVEDAGGTVIKGMGDGFIAAFSEPSLAARAALAAQKAIVGSDWSPLDFKVRMAIDTGEVERRGGDLFGPAMNRGSRLLNAGHGGQIVLSDDAQKAITRDAGAQVKSLGEHRFRGLGTPQAVHQLMGDGLANDFPPLNTSGLSIDRDRSFGDSIRGYELRERIGRGAFATVYRGYQPSIGREVAIKIVKPEFANHPAFIRRFESEARLVASFEHPHIVSIYDYWRDTDGAYIVGPYLAGRSLADATFATMSISQVIKIASQVGSALSYAHRQGVVHRDVKPANILLDSDGNAYLADFGIAARAVEAASGVQSKSVGYRAPEDRDGGAVDHRTDIYALAAVVARLLVGTPPERLEMGDIDERVRDVLARALAVDPDDRYNSVDEFLEQFATRAGGTAVALTPASHRNPYKGLAAFSQHDAPDFFGRTDEIERLVLMVGGNRLSAVIGPSGSGKSSLTLAGLLPALAAGAISGSETWISVRAVPGAYPFDELAIALSALSTEPLSALSTELAADDGKGLLRIAKRTGQELQGELVIVIDQYEELFTLVGDDAVRDRFATTLVIAATDPASRVRIVLTLRADFFHQVLTQPVLGPIISRVHLALAPLDADGIRLAIVEPAARAGLEFEPGLPERIVADLKDQPGSLPLLQFTLDRLAVAATDGFIADHQYTELGGVKGALADRAEGIFQGLTDNQMNAAQQTFTRLLSVSDEADDVRRRVRMTELESLGLAAADLGVVIDNFGRERLLTFDVDSTTRGATVEVAHEALLREWPTLRGWVDSRRESLVLQRRFQLALGEWEESDRNPSNLLTGGKLSQYEEWAAGEDISLTTAERGFLEASIERRTAETRERRARRRRVMAGFAGAAVVALLLAVIAFIQRGVADREARDARVRQLAGESILALERDPELAMLIALEAVDLSRREGVPPLPEAIGALQSANQSSRLVMRIEGGTLPAGGNHILGVAPDGSWVVTNGQPSADLIVIKLPDGDRATLRASGQDRITLPAPDQDRHASDVAVSSDGRLVAVSYVMPNLLEPAHPDVVIFDPLTGDVLNRLAVPDGAWGLDFSPDNKHLAITSGTSVSIWEVGAGSEVKRLGAQFDIEAEFSDAGFLSDGDTLVIPDQDIGLVFYSVSRQEEVRVPIEGAVSVMALSPDRTKAALLAGDRLEIYDLATSQKIQDVPNTDFQVVAWSPDGSHLAYSGFDPIISVVEVTSGTTVQHLAGSRDNVFGLAFLDQRRLANTAADEVLVWDVSSQGPPELEAIHPHSGLPEGNFAISPDQTQLAVSTWPGESFELIDVATGDLLAALGDQLFAVGLGIRTISPDFSMVGALDHSDSPYPSDSRPTVRLLPSLEVVREFEPCRSPLAFTPDSTLVLVSGYLCVEDPLPGAPDVSQVIALESGRVVLEIPSRHILWAEFNPPGDHEGGRYLALAAGAVVQLYDIEEGRLVGELTEEAVPGGFLWLAFDPHGRYLVGGTLGGRVWAIDMATVVGGEPMAAALVFNREVHTGMALRPSITTDGLLATAGADGLVRIWDLKSDRLIVEFRSEIDPPVVVFSPDGSYLLYPEQGNIARFYLDVDRLVTLAESRLTRDFTPDECRLYREPETCTTLAGA